MYILECSNTSNTNRNGIKLLHNKAVVDKRISVELLLLKYIRFHLAIGNKFDPFYDLKQYKTMDQNFSGEMDSFQ